MGTGTQNKKKNTNGVVITKTSRLIKVIDNGVLRMKFQVIPDSELNQYKHPMYKPLVP